jgi:hypothetical protein
MAKTKVLSINHMTTGNVADDTCLYRGNGYSLAESTIVLGSANECGFITISLRPS